MLSRVQRGKGSAYLLALLAFTASQAEPLPASSIRQMADAHKRSAVGLYREFLSLPNDANYPDDILRMVEWMEQAFGDRGFRLERIETPGSPLLFAERHVSDDAQTVLIYLQSDGQPVDPTAWQQEDPYTPVLKAPTASGGFERVPWDLLDSSYNPDWRVFARSASDSKGPMAQFLVAIELLDSAGFEFDYNMKVIIDTEEEMSSPHLPAAVTANRELLAADLLLIFDGPPHLYG